MSENTFLDELSKGQEDPFAELDKQEPAPAESSTEKEEVKEEPAQGEEATKEPVVNTEDKDQAFHKRWEAREAKLKAELEAGFEAKLEALRQENEQKEVPQSSNIPAWFSKLYGENSEAWEAYQEHPAALKEQIKQELREDNEREIAHARAEEQKYNQWIEDEILKLQAEGLEFDRNELIKTVLDYGPTDENNNYDFRKAYGILQLNKQVPQKPSNEAKKKIADMTSSGRSGERTAKDYVSSAEVRKTSWNDIK